MPDPSKNGNNVQRAASSDSKPARTTEKKGTKMNNKYQQVTTRCSRSRETSPTPSISFTPPQKTEEQLRLHLDGGLPGSRSGCGGGGGGRVGGGEKIGEERDRGEE